MRLRRETGDFQIVIKPGEQEGEFTVNSIRPGLGAEDLIGEVVVILYEEGDKLEIIKAAYVEDAVIIAVTDTKRLWYTKETGAIEATDYTDSQGSRPNPGLGGGGGGTSQS